MPTAIAIVAHPDDVEFRCAGTLLLLKEIGWEIHYWNLSSGNCGSLQEGSVETARRRRQESQKAAKILGARWHAPIARDLEILYAIPTVRRIAAVIREVQATVILTHPPVDYMEDHTETCRMVVTAAFAHGMPNFRSTPPRPCCPGDIALYHCAPHGLCDPLGRPVEPAFYVDTSAVHPTKMAALAAHQSQQEWLSGSQSMNSYLKTAEDDSRELGRRSKKFTHAEAWWKHLHLGLGKESHNPLSRDLRTSIRG